MSRVLDHLNLKPSYLEDEPVQIYRVVSHIVAMKIARKNLVQQFWQIFDFVKRLSS